MTDDCTALPLTLFFFMALITASIRTPHTVFDASLNRTITLFFKAKAGTDRLADPRSRIRAIEASRAPAGQPQ